MNEPVLVYALDPLCGWCFAFCDTIRALRRELDGEVSWELACGGLVVGERVGPIAMAADYLRAGMATVEACTSARFGPAFRRVLEDGTWISDSEPPCRATLVARELFGPAVAVDFASELSRGFYADGRVPDDPSNIAAAARAVGAAPEPLLDAWGSDGARAMTRRAFADARDRGIGSYPALYVAAPGQLEPILRGYASPEDALAAVRAALRATRADLGPR